MSRRSFLRRAGVGVATLAGVGFLASRAHSGWMTPRYAGFALEDLEAALSENTDGAVLRTGLCVADLDGGNVVFAQNAQSRFCCGSNRKLYLIAAALAGMDPGFRPRTLVGAVKGPQGGVIEGPLYLIGAGDPFLEEAHLDELAIRLSDRGVRRIHGPIIGDGSLFTRGRRYGADSEPSDYPIDRDPGFYARQILGQVAGLSVGRGAHSVFAAPADRIGLAPAISVRGGTGTFQIENHAVTTTDETDYLIYRKPGTNRVRVEGKIGLDGIGEGLISVPDAAYDAAIRFRASLLRHGIMVDQGASSGRAPSLVPLTEHLGLPLREYLGHLGQISDSLAAESMLRSLGVVKTGRGDVRDGLAKEEEILAGLGIRRPNFVDGSGLDPANRVTPEEVCGLLTRVAASNRPNLAKDFAACLAQPGQPGTLRLRLNNRLAIGRVQAKTGTLLDTSCLSGYMQAASGRRYAFSLMVDGTTGTSVKKAPGAIDRAILHLLGAF